MRAVYTSEVSSDYGTGQAEAASRTLIELCSLFEQYEDDIRIIGGWVPDLMFSHSGHVGELSEQHYFFDAAHTPCLIGRMHGVGGVHAPIS